MSVPQRPVGGAFGQWIEANRSALWEEVKKTTGETRETATCIGAAEFGKLAGERWKKLLDEERIKYEKAFNAASAAWTAYRCSDSFRPELCEIVRVWQLPKFPPEPPLYKGAWRVFRAENTHQVKLKLKNGLYPPEVAAKGLTRILHDMYANLSPEERGRYVQKSLKYGEEVKREHAAWKEHCQKLLYQHDMDWASRPPRPDYQDVDRIPKETREILRRYELKKIRYRKAEAARRETRNRKKAPEKDPRLAAIPATRPKNLPIVTFPRKRYTSKSTEEADLAFRRRRARIFRNKQMHARRLYRRTDVREKRRASLEMLTAKKKQEQQAKPKYRRKYCLPEGKAETDLLPKPRVVRPHQHVSERRLPPTSVPEDLVVPTEARASRRTSFARLRPIVPPNEGGPLLAVGDRVTQEFQAAERTHLDKLERSLDRLQKEGSESDSLCK